MDRLTLADVWHPENAFVLQMQARQNALAERESALRMEGERTRNRLALMSLKEAEEGQGLKREIAQLLTTPGQPTGQAPVSAGAVPGVTKTPFVPEDLGGPAGPFVPRQSANALMRTPMGQIPRDAAGGLAKRYPGAWADTMQAQNTVNVQEQQKMLFKQIEVAENAMQSAITNGDDKTVQSVSGWLKQVGVMPPGVSISSPGPKETEMTGPVTAEGLKSLLSEAEAQNLPQETVSLLKTLAPGTKLKTKHKAGKLTNVEVMKEDLSAASIAKGAAREKLRAKGIDREPTDIEVQTEIREQSAAAAGEKAAATQGAKDSPEAIAAAGERAKATAQGRVEGTLKADPYANVPKRYQPVVRAAAERAGRELSAEEQKSAMDAEDKRTRDDTDSRILKRGEKMEALREKNRERLASIRDRMVTARGGASALSKTDVDAIVEGVISGDIPPDLKGFYRQKGAIVAGLARRGYQLSQAQGEWAAVQKHIGTLNGPQQLRLRQAVEKIGPHLDVIEGLYKEWKDAGSRSGIKVFNRASLVAAKNLPGEAGSIAANLEAQIVDLQAELGNVYMGGNTPTDKALEMAAHNLKAEWNEQTFARAVKLIRKNAGLRMAAVRNTGPNGARVDSPYLPEAVRPEAAKAAGPVVPRKAGESVADYLKRVGQ